MPCISTTVMKLPTIVSMRCCAVCCSVRLVPIGFRQLCHAGHRCGTLNNSHKIVIYTAASAWGHVLMSPPYTKEYTCVFLECFDKIWSNVFKMSPKCVAWKVLKWVFIKSFVLMMHFCLIPACPTGCDACAYDSTAQGNTKCLPGGCKTNYVQKTDGTYACVRKCIYIDHLRQSTWHV